MSVPPGAGSGDPYSGSPQHQPGQPYYGVPPYGQSGQPYRQPAYGEIPTWPPPPPLPPVPPKQSKTGVLVAVAVVVLAALAGGVFLVVTNQQADLDYPDPADVAVGDCLSVHGVGDEDAAIAKPADCSAPEALWQVAANLDSTSTPCPDGDYDEYHFAAGIKFCLTLNVATGDCLAHLGTDLAELERVNCTDPSAEVVVVAVQDGVTDALGVCGTLPDSFGGVYYSDPARVLCFGHPRTI